MLLIALCAIISDADSWVKEKWTGINTISMAVRERDVNGEISIESSYFISSLKAGIQTKRLKAAWDHDYLLKILGL